MIHLRDHLGIKGVHRVVTHEPLTSLHKLIVVQFEKGVPHTEIWRALYGVASFRRAEGKWVVAVDTDIDAGSFRMPGAGFFPLVLGGILSVFSLKFEKFWGQDSQKVGTLLRQLIKK